MFFQCNHQRAQARHAETDRIIYNLLCNKVELIHFRPSLKKYEFGLYASHFSTFIFIGMIIKFKQLLCNLEGYIQI